MTKWLRRIRGALGMGLIWALGGLGVGGLLELIDNIAPGALPFIANVDMWPQTLALVGFPYGVAFGLLLGIARGRRRFEDFTILEFAGLGATAGVLLGAGAMALGAGLAFVVPTTILSTIGGAASLVLARTAEGRGLVDVGRERPSLERFASRPPLPDRGTETSDDGPESPRSIRP